CGSALQRTACLVGDDLSVHARVAAEDREAGTLRVALHPLAYAGLDLQSACGPNECHGDAYLPAVLPALRRICSFTKRTPLPLYGSGLRSERSLAATWPSSCLSALSMRMMGFLPFCCSAETLISEGSTRVMPCEKPSASCSCWPLAVAR